MPTTKNTTTTLAPLPAAAASKPAPIAPTTDTRLADARRRLAALTLAATDTASALRLAVLSEQADALDASIDVLARAVAAFDRTSR